MNTLPKRLLRFSILVGPTGHDHPLPKRNWFLCVRNGYCILYIYVYANINIDLLHGITNTKRGKNGSSFVKICKGRSVHFAKKSLRANYWNFNPTPIFVSPSNHQPTNLWKNLVIHILIPRHSNHSSLVIQVSRTRQMAPLCRWGDKGATGGLLSSLEEPQRGVNGPFGGREKLFVLHLRNSSFFCTYNRYLFI